MNMQTGPAPKQSLDAWLVWTGALELVNVVLFSVWWWMASRLLPGDSHILSLAGLLTCDLLLCEGGLYWLLVRARFFQKTPAKLRFSLLQALYGWNILAFLVFPGILLARIILGQPVEPGDALLGAAFYFFGFGEFLHYFIFKINMRPYELKFALRHRQFVPARLLRELRRARSESQQA